MIFVAVGTQFPFDRMIKYMDEWAAQHEEAVIAQIGEGDYQPQNMQWERFMDGEQYNNNIKNASVFVSHAGMGNIISAREQQTPIIVINRQYALGEHRNDHQADGLKWMGELAGVYTATTQQELNAHLNSGTLKSGDTRQLNQHQELSDFIANYIQPIQQ